MTNQDQITQIDQINTAGQEGQAQPALPTILEDFNDVWHTIATTADVLGSTVLTDAAARMENISTRILKLVTMLETHHTLLEQDANDTRQHTMGLVQDIKDQTEKHVAAIMQDGVTKVDGTIEATNMLKKILNNLRPLPAQN